MAPPNPNNTHHSVSDQMFLYYPMYPAGLQYPDSSSTIPPQVSNRFPTPGLVERQSQFTYNGGTTITSAFLAEQVPVSRNIHHATCAVHQAGLGGGTSPTGLQQTLPMSCNCFDDYCQDLSATGPLEETQPPRTDPAEPQDNRSAEPITVFNNQYYATCVVETQLNHVWDPSGSSNTHGGLYRCPPDRKPSGIWRCGHEGCPQAFTSKGSLKRHRRIAHLKTELLDCPFDGCQRVGNKGFTRGDNLRQHRRSKHGEDIPFEKVRRHGSSTVRIAR